MKKTILGITAAAVLGGAVLTPTPASAFVFLMFPAVMMTKKDPNFVAVNPYEKATKRSKKKMKT